MSKPIPLNHRLERRRRISQQGCWLWTGFISNAGYGQITMRTAEGVRRLGVHRVSYEHYVGPIAQGLWIDHLCRVRACFNPDHLEPVTPRENVMRSPIALASLNATKTHCPHGHAYDNANTIVQASGGRLCRACQLSRCNRKAVSA